MSFYYRVFAKNEKKLWLPEIEKFLEEGEIALTALGVCDEEDEDDLDAIPEEIVFVDGEDREVAVLEYNERGDDPESLLNEEIGEFYEFIKTWNPERNRDWVRNALQNTKAAYVFQVLEAGFDDENWEELATLAAWLAEETDGFEQSDGGQITNENGSIVLLEDEDASDWFEGVVAVREGDAWREKEIRSQEDFAAFLKGEI